jgi:anti-sigma-K factor RskA
MTMRDSNNSVSCREIRYLLGVYVVGAIDPAERSIVDDHLTGCQTCRDELAGLAGLPAMLSRVPAADVERLNLAPGVLDDDLPPSGDVVNSLLRRVSLRRRNRLWRGAITVAAAVAVAAAGATAAVELARPTAQPARADVASAMSSSTGVAALVDYAATPWGGTVMRVEVSGVQAGTTCQFWVLGPSGRTYAGTWTVRPSYGRSYSVASRAPSGSVRSFQITAGGKVLLTIPAS